MVRWDVLKRGHGRGDRRKVRSWGSPNIHPPPEKWCLGMMVVGTGLNLIRSNSTTRMCLVTPGYFQWKSTMSSGACTLSQGSQVLWLVPMSFHFIKYCSFWFIILLYIGFPPLPTPLCHLQFLGVVGGEMPSDDGVWWCCRELDHIKDWVILFHRLRQVETIGVVPNLPFDGKGP